MSSNNWNCALLQIQNMICFMLFTKLSLRSPNRRTGPRYCSICTISSATYSFFIVKSIISRILYQRLRDRCRFNTDIAAFGQSAHSYISHERITLVTTWVYAKPYALRWMGKCLSLHIFTSIRMCLLNVWDQRMYTDVILYYSHVYIVPILKNQIVAASH